VRLEIISVHALEFNPVVVQRNVSVVADRMQRLWGNSSAGWHFHVENARRRTVPSHLAIERWFRIELRIDDLSLIKSNGVERQHGRIRVAMRGSRFAGADSDFEKSDVSVFIQEPLVVRGGKHGIVIHGIGPLV